MSNLQEIVVTAKRPQKNPNNKQYGNFYYSANTGQWTNMNTGVVLPENNIITDKNGVFWNFGSDGNVEKVNVSQEVKNHLQQLKQERGGDPVPLTVSFLNTLNKNFYKNKVTDAKLKSMPKESPRRWDQAPLRNPSDANVANNRQAAFQKIEDYKQIMNQLWEESGHNKQKFKDSLSKLPVPKVSQSDLNAWKQQTKINKSNEISNDLDDLILKILATGAMATGAGEAANPIIQMVTKPINFAVDMGSYMVADKGLQKIGLTDDSLNGWGKWVRILPAALLGGFGADKALTTLSKKTSLVTKPTYLTWEDAVKRKDDWIKLQKRSEESINDQLNNNSLKGYLKEDALAASSRYNSEYLPKKQLIEQQRASLKGMAKEPKADLRKLIKVEEKELNNLATSMRSEQTVKDAAKQIKEVTLNNKLNLVRNRINKYDNKYSPLINYTLSNAGMQLSKVPGTYIGAVAGNAFANVPYVGDMISYALPSLGGRLYQRRLGETLYARSGGQRGLKNVVHFLQYISPLPHSDNPFAKYGKDWSSKLRKKYKYLTAAKGIVSTILGIPGTNYTGLYVSPGNITEVASGAKYSQGYTGGKGHGIRGMAYWNEKSPYFEEYGTRKLQNDDFLLSGGDTRRTSGEKIRTYRQKNIAWDDYSLLDGSPLFVDGRINPKVKPLVSTKNIPIAKAKNYISKSGKENTNMFVAYDQAGHLYIPVKNTKTGEISYVGWDYNGPGSGATSEGGFWKNALTKAFGDVLWKPATQTEVVTLSSSEKGVPVANQEGKLLAPGFIHKKGGKLSSKKLISKCQNGRTLPIPTSQFTQKYGQKMVNMYSALRSFGIPEQAAFDTTWQSLKEQPNGYYAFGRPSKDIDQWSSRSNYSLTNGLYKAARDSTNFNTFINPVLSKGYNKNSGYKAWLQKGREDAKNYLNQYLKLNNIQDKPVVQINTNSNNMV